METAIRVRVLGVGCPKCTTLEARVRRLIAEHGFHAEVEKVTDLREMMRYGIMTTPGLVVNGQLKSAGTVPEDSQIVQWLKE